MQPQPKSKSKPALILVEEPEHNFHVPYGTIFLTRDGPISEKIIGRYDSQLHAEAEAAAIALAQSKKKKNAQSEHDSGKEQTEGSVSEAALSPGSIQDDSDREPLIGWLRKLQKEVSVDLDAKRSSGGQSPPKARSPPRGRSPSRGRSSPDQDSSFMSMSSSTHSSSAFELDSFDRRSVHSSIRRSRPEPKSDLKTRTNSGMRTQDEPERQLQSKQRLDLGDAVRHGIQVAYVVGKGLTSCDDFVGMSNLQSIWLAGNKIFSLQPLAALEHLKVIDASCNSIQFFPIKPGQGAIFNKLQILFLHDNMIQRSSSLEGISHTHQLRAITLHGNPFADIPTYRSSTFDLCPNLQVLDGTFIGELDVAKAPLTRNMLVVEHARRLRRYVQHKAAALPASLTDISRNTSFPQHMVNLEEAARALQRGFAISRPTVVLQRVFRGHRGRTLFRKLNLAFAMPVLAMQRWMLKAWVAKYLVVPCTDLHASGDSEIRACLAKLPIQPTDLSHQQRLTSNSLYFLPGDALMVSALLKQCSHFFDKEMPPALFLSDVSLLRCDPANKNSIRGSPFMHHLLVRQHHRSRPLATACYLTRVKLDPAAMPYAGIARRGRRASAAERRAFASGFAWEWTPSTEGGGAPRKGERAHLLVVTFRRPAARSLFVRVIANLNRHFFSLPSAGAAGPFAAVNANRQKVIRIRHILAEVVERKIAAATITATIRGWLHRLRLRPSVGTALIMDRAARCIQDWWRWGVVFRIRMLCLTLMKERASGIDERVLYCLSPNIRERVLLADQVEPLIRESKFEMGYDANGSVRATHTHTFNNMSFHARDPASEAIVRGRPLIPRWAGLTIPAQEEGEEKDEPIGMVLSHGCEVEHFRIGGKHSKLNGETYEGEILPRRRVLGKRVVLRLRFASAEEARARMALMLLRTFRAGQRDPVLLLTAREARASLYATLIQSVFRGFLSRRWFRSIFKFVVNGLGTTFAVERAKSLTGDSAASRASRTPLPRYLMVSPGYLHAQSRRNMVMALGDSTDTIPPFEAEPGNEIKAVDGRVRTGIAWKGRRQPDLSLTGQFPATGGRWAGMPNVCPWEDKKGIGMAMRVENLEDKYELDVRNVTDHHLKKWTARGEYQRRKVVAKLMEKGKEVSLKALGMRAEGTVAKAKTLHQESSREHIQYEKARREYVSSQNQRLRRDQLEKHKAGRLVDKLTLQVAMQMRSLPPSRPRPQTSFESIASTLSSADFDEVRPQTSHVDVRLHQEFSGHFRSSASLLGYHELRVRSAKRPPCVIATPDTSSYANTRANNSRMSTAESGMMRPSSRERLQMRRRADVQRQKEQFDAMAEEMSTREASRESIHRERQKALAQDHPRSAHLLSFFDYPWVKSEEAQEVIPDMDRLGHAPRSTERAPNQHSPPSGRSSPNARRTDPRWVPHAPVRPTSTTNLHRRTTPRFEAPRPMSTPVGESAGTPFTGDPFPRPQWQIFAPGGGCSEEGSDIIELDCYSGLGRNPSTRAWTPEDVRGFGSMSRPWTPEDASVQASSGLTATNVGGALRLRPAQSAHLSGDKSRRGNPALPPRTQLAASELAGALQRQDKDALRPSGRPASSESGAMGRGLLLPQAQRLTARPKAELARPPPARQRPPRILPAPGPGVGVAGAGGGGPGGGTPRPLPELQEPRPGSGIIELELGHADDDDTRPESEEAQQIAEDLTERGSAGKAGDGAESSRQLQVHLKAPAPLAKGGAPGLRFQGRKPRRASAADVPGGADAGAGHMSSWVSWDSPIPSPFQLGPVQLSHPRSDSLPGMIRSASAKGK